MSELKCRFCFHGLTHTFADLGMSPLSNAYVKLENAQAMEPFYPLHAYVCEACFLVQLGEFEPPDHIFGDYAYFSSFADSWLAHARRYTDLMQDRFALNEDSQVIELASNDGYLLQYFQEKGIPVLGVEPAANVAKIAQEKGIPTRVAFFGVGVAESMVAEGIQADLLTANNVLAHVPDLRDFVQGIRKILKPTGVFTIEFPHLLRLMEENQFDTIYHEHFSYFSFLTVEKVFAEFGMTLFDVEELPTHGGSLRIYGCHAEVAKHPVSSNVQALKDKERAAGLGTLAPYLAFNEKLRGTKRDFLKFLIEAAEAGKTVAGYGAPAKGNTLLNFCGVKTDLIRFTVDRSPYKQNHLLPGTHIPVYAPEKLREARPDYVVILPWNLQKEIREQHAYIHEWGGRFVVPIPSVKILPSQTAAMA